MMILALLIGAGVFVGYAVYAYYNNTVPSASVPMRVWASVAMAAGAVGAAIQAWLHGVTAP